MFSSDLLNYGYGTYSKPNQYTIVLISEGEAISYEFTTYERCSTVEVWIAYYMPRQAQSWNTMYILNNTTCTLYLLTDQTTDEEQMINTIIVALIDVLAVACMIGTLLTVPTDEKH